MKLNVIDEIVGNDLCIGCGVCVGVCPEKALVIKDNEYGEYVPSELLECNSRCGTCLEVCPFSSNENETQIGTKIYADTKGIKYLFETGYYLDSYVGYSSEFRSTSASGGMTTWFLTKLLREGIVDYVVCPISQENPEKLFSFEILDNENSVKNASGSVYYPVEMSEIIKRILKYPGRYVVIGLPCFIKALRLIAQKNKKINERIIFTVGLVCGQTKNKNYTKYIAALAGNEDLGKIKNVCYRGKSPEKPANDFYFQTIDERGLQYKIFSNEGVSEAWVNRWFTPNACNYCDDIFAELADITFMDAWLLEYIKDSRGTNLIIVRSDHINNIISESMKREEVNIKHIPINKVVKSQLGVVDFKRKQLSYRLYISVKNKQKVPKKRMREIKGMGVLRREEAKIRIRMQAESKKIYNNCYHKNSVDIKTFKEEMLPNLKQIRRLALINKTFLPIRIIKFLYKKMGAQDD